MISLCFISLFVFNGLCSALTINDYKLNNHHMNRIYHGNENQDVAQNSMRSLPDSKKNEIHHTNDEKQQADSSDTGKLTKSTPMNSLSKFPEYIACLEACYNCVDDRPLKKRSIEECGPICECANSCSQMSIQQIDKIYGQGASGQGDKACFLRTYYQMADIETQLSN